MNKQINHSEEKYIVRFGYYPYAEKEWKERFDAPPLEPFLYLAQDVEVGMYLEDNLSALSVNNLYQCKYAVNAFMNAGLPKSLRGASRFEKLKFELMTGDISLDSEGQLAVNWHDGELFIEIVEIYEPEDGEVKVVKVLTRHEVLATSVGVQFYPDYEMDESHEYAKQLETQAEGEREVVPVLLSEHLLEAVIGMLNNDLTPDQQMDWREFVIYGMKREGKMILQLIAKPTAPFQGSHLMQFNFDSSPLELTEMKFGKAVKIAEVRDYFQTHATVADYHKFVDWFKRNNE